MQVIEKSKKRVIIFGLCYLLTFVVCACSEDNVNDTLYTIENEVLPAYQEYIDANVDEFNGCELVYIDDDDIPECVYMDCTVSIVLTYSNGNVIEVTGVLGSSSVRYREKTGEFMFVELAGSHFAEEYYTLENGEFLLVCYLDHSDYGDDGEEYSVIKGEVHEHIDEGKYNEYKNSFGIYNNNVDYEYNSVSEAYHTKT